MIACRVDGGVHKDPSVTETSFYFFNAALSAVKEFATYAEGRKDQNLTGPQWFTIQEDRLILSYYAKRRSKGPLRPKSPSSVRTEERAAPSRRLENRDRLTFGQNASRWHY